MPETGDIVGPAIRAFLQGQQLRRQNASDKIAQRRLELAEEGARFRQGKQKSKEEREASDTNLLNQLLQGAVGLFGQQGQPQGQPAPLPGPPTQPTAPADPFAQFVLTPEDEARITQEQGAQNVGRAQRQIEVQRQGGAPQPTAKAQEFLAASQAQAQGQPTPVAPAPQAAPSGESAFAQERAQQQVDLASPDKSLTVTVGGRSLTLNNFKGTPEKKFKRLLSAAKKDARAAGQEFDIAEFKKLFADDVLPASGKAFFKRAFKDETSTQIAQTRKTRRAEKGKPLTQEEDTQIRREVFDDAIVRFGGLPEGVEAPEGLKSLQRVAEESEATSFGAKLGTTGAEAEGPLLLTSEDAKLEARANGFPQDIREMTALQARVLLETTKSSTRTPVSDKFFFAARAAGLGPKVLTAIRKRKFDDVSQEDIQALMAELVKTDSLTALVQQILGPQAGGATPTPTDPEARRKRRDELRRKRDGK